jgi:hypothetical protein
MLELLDWSKKRGDGDAAAAPDPQASSQVLATIGAAEPGIALGELSSRLDADGAGDGKARNEALVRIQDAGEPHVAALVARCLATAAGTRRGKERGTASRLPVHGIALVGRFGHLRLRSGAASGVAWP